MRRFLALLCAAALLAGCGGRNGSAIPPSPQTATASARIIIKIPKRSTSASRSPHFISPSTKSVSIDISPLPSCANCSQTTDVNMNLTTASPQCGAGGPYVMVQCQIDVPLNPGTYTGSISMYDGALGAGNIPTGTLLSANQSFPVTINAGGVNDIPIVLDGVPAKIIFTAHTPNNELISNGTFYVYGAVGSTYMLDVDVYDPDGNLIMGPGTPAMQVAVNGTAGFQASLAGVVNVTSPQKGTKTADTLSVTLQSAACSSPGAVCAASIQLRMGQLLAIVNNNNNSISVWPIGLSAPLATVVNGISSPGFVAFDSHGNLWCSNQPAPPSTGGVVEIAPPYTGLPLWYINGNNGINSPAGIAVDSNDDLFVANTNSGTVTMYTPGQYSAPSSTISYAGARPYALYVDAHDTLYVSYPNINTVVAYAAPYTNASQGTAFNTHLNRPTSMALDSTNHLWVANQGGSSAVQFNPDGSYVQQLYVSGDATQVTISPSDTVFIASELANAVGSYALPYSTKVDIPGSTPVYSVLDENGNLYVANSGGNSVSVFAPPYTGTPWSIPATAPLSLGIWP